MSVFHGIILGVLQGIAEFLPISSSGHLIVAQNLFGLEEIPLLFDVFLHVATLLAVVLFFRKKIGELFCSFVNIFVPAKNASPEQLARKSDDAKYIAAVLLATVVTGAIGVFSSKMIPNISVKFICLGFVVTALLLVLSSVAEKKLSAKTAQAQDSAPSWKQGLVIGFAQGIGTLPGISRSGSTISGALFCGVKRNVAGEFSFIVSIPSILGAFILELKDLGEVSASIGAAPVVAGCIAAFVSGYAALSWLMKLIKKGRLEWFAVYLIPAGILGMIFLH
ncbi:undecaprenyl-diphosphate phosphatase [Treponema sp.]|uniref:undecaprenyl-diphosphate phosphatase n=1 Tax=Treponema sp. TaxID=166 RepID=UPI003F07D9F1